MKRIFLTAVLSLLVAVTVWRFTCPALLRVRFSVVPGSVHLLVLNPIRSSAANGAAVSFLKLLQSGAASDLSKRFPLIGRGVVEQNILPPIHSWVLDDVVADANGGLDFEYLYSLGTSSRKEGYIWVYCVKGTDGVWTVRTFNRVY
jgi:hypothetical protein